MMKTSIVLISLLSLFVLGSTLNSEKSHHQDTRKSPPNMKALMLPSAYSSSIFTMSDVSLNAMEKLTPQYEKETSLLDTSLNTGGGITYLEFYSGAQCSGDVTYTSGYSADLCLPSNDYVRPPFEDDDNFYYKYPFQSLMITNVTG